MFQRGSPEHIAFELACGIDKGRIIDAMEADDAAYGFSGCHFATAELDETRADDLTTRERLWIEGRYPAEFIRTWCRLAGISEPLSYSPTTGAICERYLQELSAELGSQKALRSNQAQ